MRRGASLTLAALAGAALAAACGRAPRDGGASVVLHLADRLGEARVESAAAPAARSPRVWRFDAPRPEWRAVGPVRLERLPDALRLALLPAAPGEGSFPIGGVAVDLGGLRFDDWEAVHVRARSRDRLGALALGYNLDEKDAVPGPMTFFGLGGSAAPIFSDGSVQTYALPLSPREGDRPARLRDIGVFAGGPEPGRLDLLSIALVPRGGDFGARPGVQSVGRRGVNRATLYARAPAALTYRLAVPERGRLDCALSVLAGETVTYRVAVRPPGGDRRVLLEERVADAAAWRQRRVDLAPWAGSTVELALEAASDPPGAVALWGAPVVSGRGGGARRPNVVFYVIDGGGADLMSLYGYNRRTTPFLERLAEEGVVFERAYSNSTWTQPSTASFMTSLQHSVLGGLRRGIHSTPVPAAATTMAEHMRRGGYLTAVLTANPNAGRVIGLERGVDWLEDGETRNHSTSSAELHERFWRFRAAYPGAPWWAHFQTTDVHEPNEPPPPFAGLFAGAGARARRDGMEERLWEAAAGAFGTTSIAGWYDLALERAELDRQEYFGLRRDLYDETMAYQDRELGRFVERLKRQGEWENTILVVAADHGHPAGTFARFGRGLLEPQPEPWQGALFDSYSTRVPLLVAWPGRIAGGRRIGRAVSMIDVLPTLLDLAGLPRPEVLQGRSLAPLLLGRVSEEEAGLPPVVLDEFRVDERGELVGNLEMIDGRWGASLEIGPHPGGMAAEKGRHAVPAGGRWGAVHPYFPAAPRLLLYDLWNDPFAERAVNARHPRLVERYRRLLLRQWRAHLALAGRFRQAGEVPLTPEQLQQLRSLGYIQ